MRELFREDPDDRICIAVFCVILLAQALFWIGLWLGAMKLIWWVLFVL